jgi:hypothetical protein
MRTKTLDIKMTCTLTLDESDVELLGWLAGYGGKAIAKAITGNGQYGVGLTTKYTDQDWELLWQKLRSDLEAADARFQATREVFRGHKKAVPFEVNTHTTVADTENQ